MSNLFQAETFSALCANQLSLAEDDELEVSMMGNTPTTCSTKKGWVVDDHR